MNIEQYRLKITEVTRNGEVLLPSGSLPVSLHEIGGSGLKMIYYLEPVVRGSES